MPTKTITVLSPVPEAEEPQRPLTQRPPTLDGRAVALVGDNQQNVATFMVALEKHLAARVSGVTIIRANEASKEIIIVPPTGPAKEPYKPVGLLLDEVARMADAAIAGVGH